MMRLAWTLTSLGLDASVGVLRFPIMLVWNCRTSDKKAVLSLGGVYIMSVYSIGDVGVVIDMFRRQNFEALSTMVTLASEKGTSNHYYTPRIIKHTILPLIQSFINRLGEEAQQYQQSSGQINHKDCDKMPKFLSDRCKDYLMKTKDDKAINQYFSKYSKVPLRLPQKGNEVEVLSPKLEELYNLKISGCHVDDNEFCPPFLQNLRQSSTLTIVNTLFTQLWVRDRVAKQITRILTDPISQLPKYDQGILDMMHILADFAVGKISCNRIVEVLA
eukprot:scaffold66151_cov72-Cyclotella_meneghiniana.AAC.5